MANWSQHKSMLGGVKSNIKIICSKAIGWCIQVNFGPIVSANKGH